MKKLVQVQEVAGEGLEALLGQHMEVFCMNYIYAGTLTGVNTHDILLTDVSVVFNTGTFRTGKYETAEYISKEWRIRTSAIESYGVITGK